MVIKMPVFSIQHAQDQVVELVERVAHGEKMIMTNGQSFFSMDAIRDDEVVHPSILSQIEA